jgi:hypothetical protein
MMEVSTSGQRQTQNGVVQDRAALPLTAAVSMAHACAPTTLRRRRQHTDPQAP